MAVGTKNFPTSLDTVVELVEVTNDASTALNGALTNSATTITVDSTSLFPSSGIITIDSENISYTGKTGTTFTGCTRGAESTTAATHDDNATVELLITAALPNVHAQSIIALETKLGINSSTPSSGTVLRGTGAGASDWGAIVNADISASAAIDATKIADGSISNAEFQHLNGVTSAIQTQLDAKQAAFGSQTANTVYAGPTSGGAASPSFRALVSGDIPSHNQAWSTITSTPTTLSGYGITDAAANGAVTSSGLTMATARLLGRSTATTGAIEEITVGSGLTLSAGTLSASGGGSGITVGTTTITSGTSGRVLYNNAGVVGEYSVTGSGNAVLSASPTLTGTVAAAAATFSGAITQTSASATAFESGPNGGTNPVFRLVNSTASSATGLSITGNAAGSGVTLTVLSSATNEGVTTTVKGAANHTWIWDSASANNYWQATSIGTLQGNSNVGGTKFQLVVASAVPSLRLASDTSIEFNSTNTLTSGSRDTFLRRAAAAKLAFGAADAASPVAQTLSVQNVVAGTSNTAGAAWTRDASRGTGTGAGGRHVWRTAPAGSSGSSQNSLVEACAIESSGTFKFKTLAFSALPTAIADGEAFYCSDGAVTSVADNTLTSGGTGALAVRINGVWRAFNAQN